MGIGGRLEKQSTSSLLKQTSLRSSAAGRRPTRRQGWAVSRTPRRHYKQVTCTKMPPPLNLTPAMSSTCQPCSPITGSSSSSPSPFSPTPRCTLTR
eukprot:763740-Hanusia_phi.AAC.3